MSKMYTHHIIAHRGGSRDLVRKSLWREWDSKSNDVCLRGGDARSSHNQCATPGTESIAINTSYSSYLK